MNQSDRQDRIVEYLRIKPISHGQVYTFQIAVPDSQMVQISAERREDLRRSLIEQGSNLIPLIVRRTEAYSEDEDYEVVSGTDWCLVAKELDIEKLWVWVFDLTDEQATAAQAEMERLLGLSVPGPTPPDNYIPENVTSSSLDTGNLLQQFDRSFQELKSSLQEQIGTLTDKIAQIEERTRVEGLKGLPELPPATSLSKLKGILQKQLETLWNESGKLEKEQALKLLEITEAAVNKQLKTIQEEIRERKKVNLLGAKEDIERALQDNTKANKKTIDAAWKAIDYWKRSGRGLTWENLQKSVKADSKNKDKIPGFATGTYEKLRTIGYIE